MDSIKALVSEKRAASEEIDILISQTQTLVKERSYTQAKENIKKLEEMELDDFQQKQLDELKAKPGIKSE